MEAAEYQKQASRTMRSPGVQVSESDLMLVWNAIGLAGEAGEVCEQIKKGVLHQHGVDEAKLAKEIGDVLWYAAGLCTRLGLDLGEVMKANIDKLRLRYPDGFSSADSVRRVDTMLAHDSADWGD